MKAIQKELGEQDEGQREVDDLRKKIDDAGMPEDVKKENRPYDHDYGISWIHEYGKGRVFYCAHGHSEHVYAEIERVLQEAAA